MSRASALKKNMISGWVLEVIVLISGLILPRLIITTFGSAYNGMVGAINHYLGFTTVLRAGLGAVTRAALFKPLAENDTETISSIIAATDRFMKKVSMLIGGYILIFAIVFPFVAQNEFGWWHVASMVLIISTTTFVDNLFCIKYRILLQADQKFYVQTLCAIVSHILIFLISYVMIITGFSIHAVKIGATVAALFNPLLLYIYVKKRYVIDKKAKADNSAIKQRWDAFAQQMAIVVNSNVGLVLMSFFVSLKEISVYTVHYMVTSNMEKIITSMVNGVNATFGNMIAKNEQEHLKTSFCFIEWGLCAVCAVIFSVTAVMLTPFISVYTHSVTDVNYLRPVLALAMALVAMMNCIRIPYQMLVEAAGHFKQTRNASIMEVIVNITVSLILLQFLGMLGVILGALTASVIRTGQYAIYAMKHILKISPWHLLKTGVLYLGVCMLIVLCFNGLMRSSVPNFLYWIGYSAVVAIVSFVITGIVSLIFNRKQVLYFKQRMMKRMRG